MPSDALDLSMVRIDGHGKVIFDDPRFLSFLERTRVNGPATAKSSNDRCSNGSCNGSTNKAFCRNNRQCDNSSNGAFCQFPKEQEK